MPTSLLPDSRDKQKSSHNPGDAAFDDIINRNYSPEEKRRLSELGKKEGAVNTPQASDPGDIAGLESGGWSTRLSGVATGAQASGGFISKLTGKIKTKKGGAIAGIVTLLFGGGLLLGGLFGPGLAIVNLKEVMSDKFNDTLASMDSRSTMILKKRFEGVTNGSCGTIKVLCRYSGLSSRQIRSLERAGLKVEVEREASALRHAKVSNILTADGRPIAPSEFIDEVKKNPAFRKAIQQAYNPRYFAFSDRAFTSLARKLGVTKQKNLSGTTEEDFNNKLQSTVAEGESQPLQPTGDVDEDGNPQYADSEGNLFDEDTANKINTGIEALDDAKGSVVDSGRKATLSLLKGSALAAVTVGVGGVDMLCTAYNTARVVGFGIKLVGQQQLIRYAYTFMNTADAIKAGDATAEEVSYLGNKLTDLDDFNKSAFDSFGYKYAAYGDTSVPSNDNERASAFQFSLDGGLGGTLLDITSGIPGDPQTICGVVKNPFTQVTLAVGGIALAIFSGGSSIGVGTGVSVAATAAASLAIDMLQPTIINLAAGKLVTPEMKGGETGNAITAGMGALNSQNSQAHGLAPLTKDQALAYDNLTQEVIAMNDRADAVGMNPFDIYNTSSPAHAVASTILPITTGEGSIINKLASIPSMLFSSFASLFSTKANAAEDPAKQYEICTDEEYKSQNYATDPFCNIRYGLSQASLSIDPSDLNDWMYNNGHIDDNGAPLSSAYKDFISDCIERTTPLGSTGSEGQDSDGSECKQSSGNNITDQDRFRVYYLDTSIVESMDGESVTTTDSSTNPSAGGSSGGPLVDGSPQQLAQQILSSGKVSGNTAPMQQLSKYAAGDFSCHLNPTILRVIATIIQKHSIRISSLNRYCTQTKIGQWWLSHHYLNGGGHAVDISIVNGIASTGYNETDLAMLRDILPSLPSGSTIGQRQCRQDRNKSLTVPAGIKQIEDGCNHNHIDVPYQ